MSSFDCQVCYETVQVLGAGCPTCQNKCCIRCESQFEKDTCPFCRSQLSKWFDRIVAAPNSLSAYIQEYYRVENKKCLKFNMSQILVGQMLLGDEDIYDYIQNDDLTNEDILNMLVVLRHCVYKLKNEDDIDFVLELIEYLWERVDNHDRFSIDINYIERKMFEEHKKKIKQYQRETYKQSRYHQNLKNKHFFRRRV